MSNRFAVAMLNHAQEKIFIPSRLTKLLMQSLGILVSAYTAGCTRQHISHAQPNFRLTDPASLNSSPPHLKQPWCCCICTYTPTMRATYTTCTCALCLYGITCSMIYCTQPVGWGFCPTAICLGISFAGFSSYLAKCPTCTQCTCPHEGLYASKQMVSSE